MADGADNRLTQDLARQGLLFNAIVLSVGFGLACGFGLLLATFLSLAVTGDEAGAYLNLLGVFMPGYKATPVGAFIGFFWAFVYAAISGGVLYLVYMRAAGRQASRVLKLDPSGFVTARLSGLALGVSLGAILGLQLFLSSAWLIVRGTANESVHAALLAQYLPGYSVTWAGAAIGAIELFCYALAASLLFAFIYNAIAQARSRGERSHG